MNENPLLLDEPLRDLGAPGVELGRPVRRLAEQHESRVADRIQQRVEIGRRGERSGEPLNSRHDLRARPCGLSLRCFRPCAMASLDAPRPSSSRDPPCKLKATPAAEQRPRGPWLVFCHVSRSLAQRARAWHCHLAARAAPRAARLPPRRRPSATRRPRSASRGRKGRHDLPAHHGKWRRDLGAVRPRRHL